MTRDGDRAADEATGSDPGAARRHRARAGARDLSPATFARLRGQAARPARRARRRAGCCYELLGPTPTSPATGSPPLPEPSPLDLFFDIEGDPWIGDAGLEYLFGVVEVVDGADRVPRALGRTTATAEKAAFEQFIDFVIGRLDARPGDARLPLRRLRADRAQPADEPLRHPRGRGRPAAARPASSSTSTTSSARALRASVESYSIKKIEPFYLRPARRRRSPRPGSSMVEYERWLADRRRPAPARSRRLQPRRLRLDARCCATGSRTAGARPSASSAWSSRRRPRTGCPAEAQVATPPRPRARVERADRRVPVDPADGRPTSSRALAPGAAARLAPARRQARAGGTTSACASSRSTTSSASPSRSAGSSTTGVVGEVKQSLVHRYRSRRRTTR